MLVSSAPPARIRRRATFSVNRIQFAGVGFVSRLSQLENRCLGMSKVRRFSVSL